MSQTIELTRTHGKTTIVDNADYEWLNQWKWRLEKGHSTYYAVRGRLVSEGKDNWPKKIRMHRFIMNVPKDKQTDHRDHNGLNNQRNNLRICTHTENGRNKLKQTGTSKYKGVCWKKGAIYKNKQYKGKWVVQIVIDNKPKHLGYFFDEIEAAKVYDRVAKELFGEFAYTNFT